jgi:hypothetical protein
VEVQDHQVTGANGSSGSSGSAGLTGAEGNAGTRYNFSNSTVDADPGTGIFRFNSASVTTTTVIFIDVLDAGSVDMTTYLDSWNTSNSPTKGNIGIDSQIQIRHL